MKTAWKETDKSKRNSNTAKAQRRQAARPPWLYLCFANVVDWTP
jgi:hypothetical protein